MWLTSLPTLSFLGHSAPVTVALVCSASLPLGLWPCTPFARVLFWIPLPNASTLRVIFSNRSSRTLKITPQHTDTFPPNLLHFSSYPNLHSYFLPFLLDPPDQGLCLFQSRNSSSYTILYTNIAERIGELFLQRQNCKNAFMAMIRTMCKDKAKCKCIFNFYDKNKCNARESLREICKSLHLVIRFLLLRKYFSLLKTCY